MWADRGEKRLVLFGKGLTGRDISRAIREQINNCRRRGIEPKKVWLSQYTADCLHEMWTQIAAAYDLVLPKGIAGVPCAVGVGLGNDQFLFEYHEDGKVNSAVLKPAKDNPLPDLDS